MYIINTCHPMEHLVQGYPPVVTTAECRLCGERVKLSPIEVLTNREELDSGNYVCPLCRRLIAEAESRIPDDMDLNSLFSQSAAVPFSIRRMIEMEDQYDDGYEEESDSDEAADDKPEGAGSMCPPSDEDHDAAECGGDEFSLEAELRIQIHARMIIREPRQKR